MNQVFKALSDPCRRQLLDSLKTSDGQTQGELESQFPALSRFAVMKHLKVLEAAQLLTCRRVGRYKHHYLNTVPIQEVSDRWISRFAATWSKGVLDMKEDLENDVSMVGKPQHVFNTIIQTTNEKLWDALTNPEVTRHYFLGLRVQSDWQIGSPIVHLNDAEEDICEGTIVECVPPTRIVYTFRGHKDDSGHRDPYSRICFEIEELSANACRLLILHDGFGEENTTFNNVGNGWPTILSGLKTYLETGKPLNLEN